MEVNNAEGSFEVRKGASLQNIYNGRDVFECRNVNIVRRLFMKLRYKFVISASTKFRT